jgi:hypothetical protein
MKLFLSLLLLIVINCKSQAIAPDQAKNREGEKDTVCGQIANVFYDTEANNQPTFIAMGGKYPNSVFGIIIWGDTREKFSYDLQTLNGKNICVTGTIEDYNGKPEIVVYDESQIKQN